jgi:hypothetical protein
VDLLWEKHHRRNEVHVLLGKNSVFEIGMILFFDDLLLPVDFVTSPPWHMLS